MEGDWPPIPVSKSELASACGFAPDTNSLTEDAVGRLLATAAFAAGWLVQTICPLAKLGKVAGMVAVAGGALKAVDRWRSGIVIGLGLLTMAFAVLDERLDCGGGR